ncbi:MAG: hypothetical protein ACI3XI_01470 [Eubacteriales bacterium]
MTTSELHKQISDRLFTENICTVPLDEKSLSQIEEFMMARQPGSDLMRRLSTIELNYAQISADTVDACQKASLAKESVALQLRRLTDEWKNRGFLRDFAFSLGIEDCDHVRNTFITATESTRFQINAISESLIILSQTAAQIRACAVCFTEVYHDSKLAIYAAMLNKSVEDILDCRAISLEAHACASECERASGLYLGRARTCTKIINELNSMISEVMNILKITADQTVRVNFISPIRASNTICDVITHLESINLEIKE